MAEEVDDPKDLRTKLEAALKSNADLTAKLAVHEVQGVLSTKNLHLVKAEDLKSVPPEEWESRAEAIQKERQELVLQELTRLGIEVDSEKLYAGQAGNTGQRTEEPPEADAIRRARSLGRVQGQPVPAVDPTKVHGLAAIKAGLGNQ